MQQTRRTESPENCEPGQIIVSILPGSSSSEVSNELREGALGLRYEDSLESFVSRFDAKRTAEILSEVPYKSLLLTVRDGDISAALNRVAERYGTLRDGDEPLVLAEPNGRARYETGALGTPFRLGGEHQNYLSRLGAGAAQAAGDHGSHVRVAVVDSGVDPNVSSNFMVEYRDLVNGGGTTDNYGHGTAMATLINSVAHDADLCIVRVSDTTAPLMFEVMAGIAVGVFECQAEIVNVSLGLDTGRCGACGATSTTALQHLLNAISWVQPSLYGGMAKPIFVAAVGNQAATSGFRDPASRSGVIAVGAVNSAGDRSRFSNYGTTKYEYLMAPGGDDDVNGNPLEYVGEGPPPASVKCLGTSVATAYSSGMIAVLRESHRSLSTDDFVRHVLDVHCATAHGQAPSEYGHGEIAYR